MALYRENENERFKIVAWRFREKEVLGRLAHLKLDLKLGEGPPHIIANKPGYGTLVDDVHYAAVDMYGEAAEAFVTMLEVGNVARLPWDGEARR